MFAEKQMLFAWPIRFDKARDILTKRACSINCFNDYLQFIISSSYLKVNRPIKYEQIKM